MREVRLTGRPPVVYIVLAVVCAGFAAVLVPTELWPLALAFGALVVTFALLSVRAGTVRFALLLTPEPVLELGSAFGRSRVPLAAVAAVRRRGVSGGRGPSYDVWEAVGADGAVLARGADLGLHHEGMRALETELRLRHVPLERA